MELRPDDSGNAVADVPNPGSDAALAMGCVCPVIDNGHGRKPPYEPDGWWMTVGCPVHAPLGPERVS